jgi:hypothetical protein
MGITGTRHYVVPTRLPGRDIGIFPLIVNFIGTYASQLGLASTRTHFSRLSPPFMIFVQPWFVDGKVMLTEDMHCTRLFL